MIHKRWIAIAAVIYLGLICLLAVPSLATQKTTTGTITIQVAPDPNNNQAKPIGKGKGKPTSSQSVALELSGPVRTEGNGVIKITGLSGTLTVGGTTVYKITGGKGEINNKGKIQIQAYTRDGSRKLELVLHGTITFNGYGYSYYYYYYYYGATGGPVHFTSPQSKLSSLYFLSLDGKVSFTWSS